MKLNRLGPDHYRLSGSVDFSSAVAIRADVEAVLAASRHCVLSLADVDDGNSVLVALMMGWLRFAHTRGHEVRYTDVPALLESLIEFCGLQTVLPMEREATPAAAHSD